MYAVIFRAEVNELDQSYYDMASRMRDLAMNKYGCLEFTSLTENGQEISISYWDNEGQITAWKEDPEHKSAQQLGRSKWYASYKVEIVRIEREYASDVF